MPPSEHSGPREVTGPPILQSKLLWRSELDYRDWIARHQDLCAATHWLFSSRCDSSAITEEIVVLTQSGGKCCVVLKTSCFGRITTTPPDVILHSSFFTCGGTRSAPGPIGTDRAENHRRMAWQPATGTFLRRVLSNDWRHSCQTEIILRWIIDRQGVALHCSAGDPDRVSHTFVEAVSPSRPPNRIEKSLKAPYSGILRLSCNR